MVATKEPSAIFVKAGQAQTLSMATRRRMAGGTFSARTALARIMQVRRIRREDNMESTL
jgi:hypothetical protein